MTATAHALELPPGVAIRGDRRPGFERVLTLDALAFVAKLERAVGPLRIAALAERQAVQARLDAGEDPRFGDPASEARAGDWRVRPAPADLADRRVEITGPVDRKMIINALNSGAKCFMADFEDASSPTWTNMVEGQINLMDAVRRTITFEDPATGKAYALGPNPATLIVRPRGWHLNEIHLEIDGGPATGGLVDFGLYIFHNARALADIGSGPYFYLPKLENGNEAAIWARAFTLAEDELGLPRGTIRCTVLIETILATFQLDEILFALKDWIAALNCGRWDYIFSYIKRFRNRPDRLLPDRGQVTMTQPFLRAYTRLVIETCHRRGAHAMGGMSAFIPVKGDEAANAKAFAQLTMDKEREAGDGHDGTWVAHPGMVETAMTVFDRLMPTPNQVARLNGFSTTEADLLAPAPGTITEAGVRLNASVAMQYIAAWLRGQGAVPINNLMEDAATAEISRAQLWQWRIHGAATDQGQKIDDAFLTRVLDEELGVLREKLGPDFETSRILEAADLLRDLVFAERFEEFLTLPAYRRIVSV